MTAREGGANDRGGSRRRQSLRAGGERVPGGGHVVDEKEAPAPDPLRMGDGVCALYVPAPLLRAVQGGLRAVVADLAQGGLGLQAPDGGGRGGDEPRLVEATGEIPQRADRDRSEERRVGKECYS